MNTNERNTLINGMYGDENFAALHTHRDRVQYLLSEYASYGKLRQVVKANVDATRVKVGKNFTRAKLSKTEADMFARRAEQDGAAGQQLWDRALQSYTKVSVLPFASHITNPTLP